MNRFPVIYDYVRIIDMPRHELSVQEEPLGRPILINPPVSLREAIERIWKAERRGGRAPTVLLLVEEALAERRRKGMPS